MLAELVENKTGENTDFDYLGEFESMEEMRKNKRRLSYLLSKGSQGFKTLDDRLVKVKAYKRAGKYFSGTKTAERICRDLQLIGPMLTKIRLHKNTSLTKCGFNKVLKKISGEWTRSTHAIVITGFNLKRETFIIQNSWGLKKSYREIKWKDFVKIFREGYFIKTISITD